MDQFSAGRAFRHVGVVAREPHPRGSPALAMVRDYLVSQLRALGLEPFIERGSTSLGKEAPVPVENILVRKRGTANTRAVALSVHYDSVKSGPGAGDNGAAVAALLETLRALNSGPRLRNDLIIVITDNEEYGGHGARLFITEHPWFNDLGLVFNFDARGNRGPSMMFETSADNGDLVAEFSKGVPHIMATSLATAVYNRMPNGTDFTQFKRKGVPGLNFAFIEGAENYHRPSDTPANLSLDTLQHTGDIMLNLARHFGNVDLPLPAKGDAVYFNVIGPWFVHYPETWVTGFSVLLLAVAIASCRILWREKHLRFPRLVVALLGLLLAAGISFGIGWLILRNVKLLAHFVPMPGGLVFSALLLSAFGVAFVLKVTARWATAFELVTAALVLWTVMAVASFKFPPGSYVYLWPSLMGWIGLFVWRLLGERRRSLLGFIALLAGTWTAIVMISPLCGLLWIALPPALPVVTVLSALMFWPLLGALTRENRANP